MKTHRSKVESLPDIQNLQKAEASGARRRGRKDFQSPVETPERRPDDGTITFQIGPGDDTPAAMHLILEQAGGLPPVKAIHTVVPDPRQGARKVGLAKGIPL